MPWQPTWRPAAGWIRARGGLRADLRAAHINVAPLQEIEVKTWLRERFFTKAGSSRTHGPMWRECQCFESAFMIPPLRSPPRPSRAGVGYCWIWWATSDRPGAVYSDSPGLRSCGDHRSSHSQCFRAGSPRSRRAYQARTGKPSRPSTAARLRWTIGRIHIDGARAFRQYVQRIARAPLQSARSSRSRANRQFRTTHEERAQ